MDAIKHWMISLLQKGDLDVKENTVPVSNISPVEDQEHPWMNMATNGVVAISIIVSDPEYF